MKKAVVLLSSGIDSPVAAHLMKDKFDLIALHFDHKPLRATKEARIKKLCEKIGIRKYCIVPFGFIQIEIIKKCKSSYRCLLCRRFMFRLAEKIAKKEKAKYIITGESLGQVASQILQNIKNITKSIKINVLRPLLTYDKQETINIAKAIGTYDISIQENSCCGAVPKDPTTRSDLKIILQEEKKINIKKLMEKALKGLKHESIN